MSQKVTEGIVLATCLLFAAIASGQEMIAEPADCLLYTSDAADE